MKVLVVPHDPRWSNEFADESQRVMRALGDNARQAHHIGSTAIPGIKAKPVIDLLIEVVTIADVDSRNIQMAELGYEALGECGIPERRYFRKDREPGIRTHNIHVFAAGSDQARRHLAFRDFMNAHPDWAARYSDLKSRLAKQFPDSIEDYMDGKDAFIKEMDRLAEAWHSSSTST